MTDNGSANSSEEVSPATSSQDAPAKPARKRYSSGTAAPAAKPPFAFQAAKIAFWAPFIGIGLGLLSYMLNSSARNAGDVAMQRDIAFFVVGTELILMLLTLFMGTVALLAIRKHGKKGLLVRPLIGMIIAATILAIPAYSIYMQVTEPERRLRQVEALIAGEWEIEARMENMPITIRLSLRPDHTGSWKISGTRPVDLSGKWELVPRDRVYVLTLSLDAPQDQKVKVEGFLRDIRQDELTLSNVTKDGQVLDQKFKRVK